MKLENKVKQLDKSDRSFVSCKLKKLNYLGILDCLVRLEKWVKNY